MCPSISPSIVRTSVFSFPDDNWSECQWISTKLYMRIDIAEIWVGLANGQSSPIFDSYLPATRLRFSFPDDNLSECQWIFIKLVCALTLYRFGLRMLMGNFVKS